ncbi:MAG TPA: hypothetical protein PKH77_19860 [Anaerolineae bacterium]|nr:hypothetical protein [Anaerolineae bacterium]
MTALPASLRRWRAVIQHFDDERDTDDGYWLYLKPGYADSDGETVIHEDRLRDLITRLHTVTERRKSAN